MQVPMIDRLDDLQVGFNSLQNPPFLSQITSSLTEIQSVSVVFNFCKWGAVILAVVATFGSIINRITIFIIRFRRKVSSLPNIPLHSNFDDDDFSSTDEEDDDGTYSSPSNLSSDLEDEDEDDELSESSRLWRIDEYFRVKGESHQVDDQFHSVNGKLIRRRSIGEFFSLSEIAKSRSVVKLWDSIGFGLGLDFDDFDPAAGDFISDYDDNKGHRFSSISGVKQPTPAISTASPAVVLSAGESASGNMALEIWDTRLRRRKPTVIAEWGPNLGKTVRVESGGVQKVYVRDDGRYGVTVGDMRNVRAPLVTVTESDADTWWDADAVIVSD